MVVKNLYLCVVVECPDGRVGTVMEVTALAYTTNIDIRICLGIVGILPPCNSDSQFEGCALP